MATMENSPTQLVSPPTSGAEPAVHIKRELDRVYETYNRAVFIKPDPLQFLYEYDDPLEREVVGMVASSLAFGNVAQILASVRSVLDRMKKPRPFIDNASHRSLQRTFAGFRHRYVTGTDLADTLWGVKNAFLHYGSLGACFSAGLRPDHETVLPALTEFVDRLRETSRLPRNFLLPSPRSGSACKRLNLFLRWMVRRDEVDCGGWDDVSPAKLIVPMDVHMHRFGRALRLTSRRQADGRTALEVTAALRQIVPHDPVRYDFALTRLAIRKDGNAQALLHSLNLPLPAPAAR
jgi:uncharacterized protein (TIGR02757 family)